MARFDPATGEKRKLRKSYKNHISDLPGKHEVPTRENEQPGIGSASMSRGDVAPTLLSIVYSTQNQYQKPIPVLTPQAEATTAGMSAAAHAPGEEYRYRYLEAYEPDLLRRAFGALEKTPISGIPDFDVSKLAIPPVSRLADQAAANGGGGVSALTPNHGMMNGARPNGNSSTLGGSLMKSVSSSSLHFSSKLSTSASNAAESSNDDATVMRIPLKKKKRKERTHTSVSPTSSTGMGGLDAHDVKRRKTTPAISI